MAVKLPVSLPGGHTEHIITNKFLIPACHTLISGVFSEEYFPLSHTKTGIGLCLKRRGLIITHSLQKVSAEC